MSGKANADQLTEPLKTLIVSPSGHGLIESELWDAAELDRGLDTLIATEVQPEYNLNPPRIGSHIK